MNELTKRVAGAMLAIQRYPWEQGVCAQAMYEAGVENVWVPMAHDAILRQKEDGRLAVINSNIAVTDLSCRQRRGLPACLGADGR